MPPTFPNNPPIDAPLPSSIFFLAFSSGSSGAVLKSTGFLMFLSFSPAPHEFNKKRRDKRREEAEAGDGWVYAARVECN